MKCTNSGCSYVWWHASCAGFSKNTAKKDLEKVGAWTCPSCIMSKFQVCDKGDEQAEIISKMDEKLDDLNGHIADLKAIKEELSEIGKQQVENQKLWSDVVRVDDPDSAVKNTSKSFASSLAKEVIHQTNHVLHDRENREKNIIVFNAKELESDVVDDRKTHDTELFNTLCNHVVGGTISFDKITRIGKRNSPSSEESNTDASEEVKKIRPMKVCFTDAFDKRKFLASLWKLKGAPAELANLRIQHDLNKDERATTSRLLTEAYEKNTNEKPSGFLYKVRGPPYALKIVKVYQK